MYIITVDFLYWDCVLQLCWTHSFCCMCVFLRIVCVCVCVQSLSCVWLFVTPWTLAYQILLSMEFSRQEYWSGLPFPPPGGLPNSGLEPSSLVSPALAGGFFISVPPGKPQGWPYHLWIFRDSFTSSFPIWISFISSLSLIAMTRTSSSVNVSSEGWHPFLDPYPEEKAFSMLLLCYCVWGSLSSI